MANPSSQDDRFYNPNSLKKAFAISAVFMMVATVWMILDDFGREWKGYQREFLALKERKYAKQVEEAKAAIDADALKEAEAAVAAADKDLQARKAQIDKIETEIVDLTTQKKNKTVVFQAFKGDWDVERYQFEAKWGHKVAEGKAESIAALPAAGQKAYQDLMKGWEKALKLQNDANAASQALEAKQKELAALRAAREEAEKNLKALQADVEKARTAKENSEFTLRKLVRSSPIIDLADPVFRLQQIVLPEIRDDLFFAQAQKVDRCTTCHQAIDTPGFEDAPQPFRTHPRLDLILGSRSPHPIDQVGCTICHDGRGQATHFVRAAHTPRNEEQKKAWRKAYGWNEHDQHHIMEKMVPLQYTEGKCRVCHRETEYVPRAPKATKATQMVKAAGCYGCHKIEGWEHVEKPAPSLLKVKGKLDRDWIVKWVRDPRSFNPNARMPSSFFQSNTQDNPVYAKYQEAELHGVVDYLLANSEGYRPGMRAGSGNAERGKDIFGSVGCLGCHNIDDFENKNGRWNMAPDLSTVGSKVGRDWLVTWIRNPTHYRPDTRMPSLRLTEGEANDVAAYLMSKRNDTFEDAEAGRPDPEVQKQVLRLYLLRDPKLAPTTEAKINDVISKLSSHDLSVELGRRAIGQYGCFGCHQIKGFEGVGGIGPELTEEWSKPITKFDFGMLHDLPHTKIAWFDKKLDNARAFDKGLVKDYLDLLRMPNFGFTQDDRDAFITALVGMTAEKPLAKKVMSARDRMVEQGARVVHKYNCQGCHVMEDIWSPIPDDHPDYEKNEGEKYRTEGRILVHYEEDETLGPPKILHEGFRVHTDWVNRFLADPGNQKLRQSLKVRMPTFNFSLDERNALLNYWGNMAEVPYPLVSHEPVRLSPKQVQDARTLFSKLQCLQCHNLGEKLSAEELEGGSKGLAPNLRLAAGRLRREWMVAFLKDPNKWIPGTRMPGFWAEGNSLVPEILGGDSEKQINLLVDYLIFLGQNGGGKAE